jgi:hypothetical protein
MSQPFLTVPARSDLSIEEFRRDFVHERKPVVIKGALDRWKALSWTPEYLKQAAGSRIVRYRTEQGVKSGRWSDLIDLVWSDRPAPYLRNIDLRTELPALARDIEPVPEYAADNWRDHVLMTRNWPAEIKKDLYELFVSQTATTFPYLHVDYWGMSAFFAQLFGEKEVILFPREDAPHLYPTDKDPLVSSIRDFDDPDYGTFPALRQARQYRVTLGPGDLLFNPRWWHTTRTLKPSITVIWAYWNKHEWDDLLHYVRTRVGRRWRPALVPYLRLVGFCNALTA